MAEGEFEVTMTVVVRSFGHALKDARSIERVVARVLRSEFGDRVEVRGDEGQLVAPDR